MCKTDKRIADEYAFLLLAGGKSSRMGTDKASLCYRGHTFLEILLAKGSSLGLKRCYVSGHAWKGAGVQVIEDRCKGRGPLEGLHACMETMDTPYCLVVPVDVPQIPVAALGELLECHQSIRKQGKSPIALLLKHGNRTEPLIGIYDTRFAYSAEQAIRNGNRSVFDVLETVGYEVCQQELSAYQAENINTPEDYRGLLEGEV